MKLKEVPGFPEYKVTRDGRLYSVRKKKFIKPRYNGFKMYPRYVLWRNGVRKLVWCHRLIATVFIGNADYKNVHHRDGDPLNFHADNLAILTPKEHREHHMRLRAKIRKQQAEELKKQCPF